MKARILGLVALLIAMAPFQVHADDAAIAKHLSKQLQTAQKVGNLRHFRIGVKVEEGTVWMKGRVASEEHRDLALDKARRVEGVKLVVNDIEVSPVAQASAVEATTNIPKAAKSLGRQAPARIADARARNAAGVGTGVRAARGGRQVDYSSVVGDVVGEYNHHVISEGVVSGGGYSGNPVPVSGGVGGGSYTGEAVYEGAQMPNYAWPSYAAHPNYAGVQYPSQYSPMAWPYIGPFYPYPQVPLGWRKVQLEWDDGWWQLDFKHK